MLLSFDIDKQPATGEKEKIILAGDVGATKTNLALFQYKHGKLEVLSEENYRSAGYSNILSMADDFLRKQKKPDVICFGVAGPVLLGHAMLSNIHWQLDSDEIAAHFGIQATCLINDLEATAFGLAMLTESDVTTVMAPGENIAGNAAIIAPGTGLGEAGLYKDSNNIYHPFATEGGHCDFAPRNEFDFELYCFLRKEYEHVSWERLICGPGILNIYRFLRDVKKREEPGWLTEKFKNADPAAVISGHADQSKICGEAMQTFVRYLAYESANLVLKFKATGGLFIGGGIIPQIVPLIKTKLFYDSFCSSGRLNYLLEKTPVKIILNPKAALLGAAYYALRL